MSCSEVNILGKKYQEDCPMEDEDHISNLPDDVISHILSCLPTFDAVATCVLAKQWKYKWTSIFNIIIDRRDMSSRYHRTDIVMENVLLHVHNVRRAILMLAHGYDVSTVASWISTLLEKNIKVLHLHLPMNENFKNSTMPNSILNNNSLRELRLLGKYIIKLATRNYCANIRSLILINVVIKSEGSINDTLVFTFPALETLEIWACKWSKVRCVEIYAPALNKLNSEPFNKFDGYTMKIFASSSFERFESAGVGPESFLLHGSSIVSADLVNYSSHCSKAYPRQFKEALDKSALNIGKLLRQFSPTLENLTVSVYSAQAILESRQGFSRPICEKLRRLVLIDPQHHAYKMETLLELLHATPFLKVLVLDVKTWDAYDYDAVESTPSCITSYLEEVELRDLTGKAPQVCLAKFLLETTKVLKRFCYRTYTCKRERNEDIMEQLAKFPRAPTCALIFIPGLNRSYRSRNYFW